MVVPSEANGKADKGGFVVPHELSTTAIARVTIEMTTGRLLRRFMGLRRLGGRERGGCKLVAVAAVVTPEHDICVTERLLCGLRTRRSARSGRSAPNTPRSMSNDHLMPHLSGLLRPMAS